MKSEERNVESVNLPFAQETQKPGEVIGCFPSRRGEATKAKSKSNIVSSPRQSPSTQMGMGDMKFMIEIQNNEAPPTQHIRELTQNAIEAIVAAGGKGDILWDYDKEWFAKTGYKKLCVIDTGTGMDEDTIRKYLNVLGQTSKGQSLQGNFGIGVKTTALPRNPHGIVYSTWMKDSDGKMCQLHLDPNTGQYAMKSFAIDTEGTEFSDIVFAKEMQPELICESKHGTKVTLLGHDESEDTTRPPEEADFHSRWVSTVINRRYFQFPSGIRVRAWFEWMDGKKKKIERSLYTVKGQKNFFDKKEISSGSVRLNRSKATAHWWIFRNSRDEKDKGATDQHIVHGHVAALYKNEIYGATKVGTPSITRLQLFNCIFGHKNVAIYIEPDPKTVTTNGVRTNLFVNKGELPWEQYAEEFRKHFPKELEEHEKKAGKLVGGVLSKAEVRRFFKAAFNDYKLSRYKLTPTGKLKVSPATSPSTKSGETISVAVAGDQAVEITPGDGSGRGPICGSGKGLRKVKITSSETTERFFVDQEKEMDKRKKEKEEAEKKKAEAIEASIPKVKWLEGEMVKDNGIEDCAAKYIKHKNLILANKDFRLFTDIAAKLTKAVELKAGGPEAVRELVFKEYEMQLTEVILGTTSLSNARFWGAAQMEKAQSPEALTASVMPRIRTIKAIKSAIHSKIGVKMSELDDAWKKPIED